MSRWFRNGKPVTTVSIDDRGFHYGDGLFETIAVRDGQPRLWGHHMERLSLGCERLSIRMPDVARLQAELHLALEQEYPESADCVVKIILSAGRGQRGYGREPGGTGILLIGLFDYAPLPRAVFVAGIDSVICETALATHSATAGLKTLNRLEQVLGRAECLAADAFEGLMLDAEKRLICGTMSNVFIVAGNSIITPSLQRCGVAGVMRRRLLQLLEQRGKAVTVSDVSIDDLRSCDEIFLTNSQFGAIPVRRCGSHEWAVGGVTRQCQLLLAQNGVRECSL